MIAVIINGLKTECRYYINMDIIEKPFRFVTEGADGSGKTTFFDKLKELYPDIAFEDRQIVSDIVYNRKFKRKEFNGVPVDIHEQYWLYKHKNTETYCNILFTADKYTLARRAIEKEESFCRNRTFEEIADYLYQDDMEFKRVTLQLYQAWGFDYIEIDTSYMLFEDNLELIKGFIDGKLRV